MTTTLLTDEQIKSALISAGYVRADFKLTPQALANSRAIEQAVLQSPEIQALRKDAEAFRLMVSFRLTVKVDEVCSDVEVFHLGECLAWPPAHHCENDEEVAAVAREAIQKAVATLKEKS